MKKNLQRNPEPYFISVIFLINLIMAIYLIFSSGNDEFARYYSASHPRDLPLNAPTSEILQALAITFLCYFFFIYLYRFFSKIKTKNRTTPPSHTTPSGSLFYFVLFLQLSFLFLYFATGYGKAGETELIDTQFKYFFILLPVDYLFFVYLAVETNKNRANINILVYIASSFSRGWAGGILFILLFKTYSIIKNGEISYRYFLWGLAAITLLPLIVVTKFFFRAKKDLTLSYIFSEDFFYAIQDSMPEISYYGYYIFDNLLVRLQLIIPVMDIAKIKDSLHYAYNSGLIRPFFDEGIIQVALRRFSMSSDSPILAGYITYLTESSFFSPGDAWATNPTLASYFIFADFTTATFYALYVATLLGAAIFLSKKYIATEKSNQITWIVALFFIVPGWTGAFMSYVQAQAIIAFMLHKDKIRARQKLHLRKH